MLQTENLVIGYTTKKKKIIILKELNLILEKGKLISLLGANGTGKSTLLRTLSNIQPAIKGQVWLEGKKLNDYASKELARKMSIVLSEKSTVSNIIVLELLRLSRSPYTNWLGITNKNDKEIINNALKLTHTEKFINQAIGKLSDGEYQRVMIARALVQDTNIIILDEPTAHLDVLSRMEIMNLLRSLAQRTKKSILVATHEIELAMQISHEIWLIDNKQNLETGIPEDLILKGVFEKAFQKKGYLFDRQEGRFSIEQIKSKPIQLEGAGIPFIWTKRALKREGFYLSNENDNTPKIKISYNNNKLLWNYTFNSINKNHSSLQSLLKYL